MPASGILARAISNTVIASGAKQSLAVDGPDGRRLPRRVHALLAMTHVSLPSLEPARRALFGEGARGFLEVLGQVKLERRGDELRLADQAVEIPAPRAHRRANTERRVLGDLERQFARDLKHFSRRGDAVEDTGGEPFLGGEEPAGQGDLLAERGRVAVMEQRP